MKSPYKTKQREDIISYLGTTGGRHFTAADICRHFQERGRPIGTATVYRQLEKLVDEGQVKKYALSDGGSACYEYIDLLVKFAAESLFRAQAQKGIQARNIRGGEFV